MTTFKNIWLKLYGSWKKSINIEEILHKREEEIKGNKITIEGTNDMWKTKTTIMIEKSEIFDLISFLQKWIWNITFKRQTTKTKDNKSIEIFTNKDTWDTLIKVDSSNKKDKVLIKLDNLNKMLLSKICNNQLIKEIKRVNGIIITKEELKDYIRENNNNNNKTTNNTEQIINKENNKELSYINDYNWKKNENKILVNDTVYNYIKTLNTSSITENNKIELIKKLKWISEKNGEQYFFLRSDNIDTLQCV